MKRSDHSRVQRLALCALLTAVMLALTVRLYRRYHTLDIDVITSLARKEEAD